MALIYKDEAFQIIGAAQEVHRQLGYCQFFTKGIL